MRSAELANRDDAADVVACRSDKKANPDLHSTASVELDEHHEFPGALAVAAAAMPND